jgi:hypothetical protein
MKQFFWVVALLASCLPALGQSGKPIIQSGNVTPTHAWCVTTNGIAQDCGTAAIPFLTSIGAVYPGPSICAWSALSTSGAAQELCLGATNTGGATITVQNYGTASALPLSLSLNGTTYQFPFSISGVAGPATTIVGDIAVWNNSTGTLLADLGGGAPWSAQVHQSGGGTNFGHVLMWADQNTSQQADTFSVFSNDQSLLYSVTIGGTPVAGNTVTLTGTLASTAFPIVYTVQSGDTTSTIATALAACIQGGSTHCTGGAAFVAALLAFHGTDGFGYRPGASASGAVISMDFPWAASGNSLTSSATGGGATITVGAGTNLDNGPIFTTGRYVAGRTPVAGDQPFNFQIGCQSGANTGIDANCGLFGLDYLGTASSAHVYAAEFFAGAANSNQGPVAWYVGPQGVYTADTAGDGNGCGGFSVDTYSANDPGFGNLSVCGIAYVKGSVAGGSAANSTLIVQSTSNGSPSGDVVYLDASVISVRPTLGGSGSAQLGIGVQGTSTGFLIMASPTANQMILTDATNASGTATIPNGTYNIVGDSIAQTLTNKTIASSTDTLGGVTMGVGSDATGDIYYRNSGGQLTRLPIGSTNQQLAVHAGGLPAWTASTNSMAYLCTITASNSASLNNASPTSGSCPLNSTYTSYELIFQNIVPATNEKILELQVHSGGVYKSTGYLSNQVIFINNGSLGAGSITTYIPLTYPLDSNGDALGNTAPGFSGQVFITNPSASNFATIYGNGMYLDGGGAVGNNLTTGYWNTSGAVDGFQVLMDSGNITSGSILVYGIQ